LGRLAGFAYTDVVRRLRRLGFEFDRHAKGSHEIWRRSSDGRKTTVPRHPGDIPEGTLRAILRQAGIDADDFLRQ
jgi:predicted RNA binding protein YcfA (HicA-like mRNA interferase family)